MATGEVLDLRVKATIDGADLGLQFHSIEISQRLFKPTKIRLEAGYTDDRERGKLQDKLGRQVSVVIHDAVAKDISQKYNGVITGFVLTDDNIILEAQSVDYRLKAGRQHRVFQQMKISDIVQKIIGEHGIASSIDATDGQFDLIQQYGETDLEFITRLASYCGYAFYHDGEKFQFLKDLSNAQKISVAAPDLNEITMRCQIEDVLKKVGAFYNPELHNNPGDGKAESQSIKPEIAGVNDVYASSRKDEEFNTQLTSKQALLQFLKASEARAAGEYVRVHGETHHPMVVVGRAVESDDPILRKNNVVVSLEATFKGNVYTGVFEAMPKAIPVSPELPDLKHSLMLQPAVVTNNKDDKKLGRVKVKFAWASDDETYWARVVQAGAGGPDHGTHFTPRVDDMVLVGFENGDVAHPVVLGSLYHSEKKPSFETENGTAEILVAKTPISTIRVVDKDSDEYITITMKETKNVIKLELKGPKITIESDGGTVVLHSKTIQITADDKIEMKANDIEMTAQKNITCNATGDFKVSATGKVALSATSEASISSSAKASISAAMVESSASATNTIKGALVQIN